MSVVQVLLDHRADVGAHDRGGDTPLHRAASGDAAAAAALLLDRDGDLSAGAHDGVTPLHVAALKDAGPVARVLPSHGVNVDARADDGVTALHVAAMKDASGIVVALVTHGADLNATDAAGQAALHWAASEDAVAAVEALLDRGASLHARADDGSKPRGDVCHLHAERGDAERCGVLLGGTPERTPELVRLEEVRPAVYRVVWSLSTAASGRLRPAKAALLTVRPRKASERRWSARDR